MSEHTDTPLVRLRTLAAEHREKLETEAVERQREVERLQREAEDRQRRAIEQDADEYVTLAFPATLAHVVSADAWQGYPGDDSSRAHGPSAVAYLGDDVWLHYTDLSGAWPTLTLLQPCIHCHRHAEEGLYGDDDVVYVLDTGVLPLCSRC